MAADTTILSGDVGVWWLSNNRCKMLTWEGSTGTYTMNELYSAMQTLQDEADTIDDGTCFNADTPTEYTTGKIDSSDAEPWYISFDLMEHITGGSLRTTGWTHANGSNAGIVIVPGTNVDIVAGDIGIDISGNEDGNGTLLELIEGDNGDFLVIRPDSSATGDEFTGGGDGQTLTCNAHTFTQSSEEQNSGEMIWANIYSIGTIDDNVHLYVYQGPWNSETATSPATDESTRVYSVNSSSVDYWGNGHIDICVPIKDWWRAQSDGAWAAVDSGYLRVFARKGGDLYASFEVTNSTTSGGRNPVPLQTSVDLNQGTGTKTISFTGSPSGTLIDGEVIVGGTSNGRGILDLTNSDVGAGGYLSYFPIATAADGGALTPLQSGETVTGDDSTESVTTDGAPALAGPSLTTWFTNNAFPDVEFGDTNVQAAADGLDIDNDGTDEHWGILVDCNENPLTEVYEYLKFICQYTQGDTDRIEQALTDDLTQANVYGEEFVGAEAYFIYGTLNGTINEGDSVEQATSGATGVILSIDTTDKVVLLRNVRGSFNGTNNVLDDVSGGSNYFSGLTEGSSFAASTSSPFGTFAGGTFFGARGVLLENWLATDDNSFILTDIEGTTRERPLSITFKVDNLWGTAITEGDADLVAIYLLDGANGNIEKDTMTANGTESAGDTTLSVDDIPTWVPSNGRIVLVDDSDDSSEYVLRYSSWSASTDDFTLANQASAATAGTTTTQLVDSGGSFLTTVQRGDLVYHTSGIAYVIEVDSDTTLQLDRVISGLASGQNYEINCVPVNIQQNTDTVYALIMHAYPTTTSKEISLVYPGSAMYYRVRVRNTRETDLTNGPIKPYSSDGTTSGTDVTVQTVRTIDTIIS
jgi:hypothetical protein